MLITIELMLAGLCINIPMLRPFYIRLRSKYKSTHSSNSRGHSELKLSGAGNLNPSQPRPANYTAWIELVCWTGDATRFTRNLSLIWTCRTRLTPMKADKDQTTVTGDDASSERKLTAEQPDDAILVHKDWVVSRV
jgi:hypothetical protein